MLLKLSSAKKETPGVKSFIWEKPAGFNFYPGQYLEYKLPVYPERSRRTDSDDNSKAFTISSSPTEGFLMLTTREGQSNFKKKLFTLQPGDTTKTSHPAGTFILDETSPAIMIAGGIGITPFRSMIKYAHDQKLTTPITLIYSNSDENFIFQDELKAWQKNLPNLTIIWINTAEEGLLDKENLSSLATKYQLPNTIFYLAGPTKMVDSFDQILQELGIEETNIRYDHFGGYL